jgi:phosphomannomutase
MSVLMLSVSGCRGVVGETLTPEVIARFAGSYGSWLRQRVGGKRVTVVLGRDGRAGGEMVRNAAIAGLAGAGCDSVDIGVAMTPTVAVMTDRYARDAEAMGRAGGAPGIVAGMVLTASHNPQQWNGLKCLLAEGGEHGSAACAPAATFAHEIIERFKGVGGGGPVNVGWREIGKAQLDEASVQVHVDRVLGAIEDAGLCADAGVIGAGMNVAVDCVNASGVVGSRLMLESLGCEEILQLNNEESGLFPHPPEPTLENLSLPGGLCDAVREVEADVGFAQDPDADRLAIIDENGRYIGEEYTLVLGAMAIMEAEQKLTGNAKGQVLVTNLSTSRMLEDVAAKYGARVLRTPVGDANVVEWMKRDKAIAGGEGNGGVIWPRVTYVRDSLSAMALVLWLLSPAGGGRGQKRRLSDLIKSMPSYAIEKRKVDLKRREDSLPAIEKISKAYKSERIDLQDGVRIDWQTGPLAGKAWLHVRASNTEPIMRLIAEAPTKGDSVRILDEAARAISG